MARGGTTRKRADRKKRTRTTVLTKKRSRYLEGVVDIRLDDCEFLQKFLTDHGKIMPLRLTGATAKQQRQIKKGVRRARVMGLLP